MNTASCPGWIMAGLALASAAPAGANPWPMARGEGRIIATGIYSHADRIFDSSGHSVDAPDYDQLMAYFYTEYGLTDDITVIANPGLKRIEVEGGGNHFGLEGIELGARYRITQDQRWTLSAQASAFIPGSAPNARIAQVGGSDFQAEARLQAGYGFTLGSRSGFASAEAGYRLRSGSAPDEFRGDLGLGLHLTPKAMAIANLFNTWSNGRGHAGFPSYRYSNLYAGGVIDVTPQVAIQLGALATVSGRNALRERGMYSGFWLKF